MDEPTNTNVQQDPAPGMLGRWVRAINVWQERERQKLLSEVLKINGLMALLMKQRNGLRWSKDDRAELRWHLLELRRLGCYITGLIAPGGFLLLPILAWWLDRRKSRRLQK